MTGPPEPYPAETSRGEHLRCTVCGGEFDVVTAGGDERRDEEIPNAAAFLSRHRRCLKELLSTGGVAATPAVRRGRNGRS